MLVCDFVATPAPIVRRVLHAAIVKGIRLREQQIGILGTPDQTSLRSFVWWGRIAVHRQPAVERIHVVFKRRHDGIRIFEVDHVDRPLSDAVSRQLLPGSHG